MDDHFCSYLHFSDFNTSQSMLRYSNLFLSKLRSINIDDDKQFVIQIGYGLKGVIKFHGQNKLLSNSIQLPFEFNNDDTFKLRINFKKRDIELYHNQKFIAIIFNQIPLNTKLRPCIALKNAQIQILSSNYMAT